MDGGEKTLWIIANWKSNKTIAEALDWLNIVGPKLTNNENLPAGRQGLKVVVCPAFSCLAELKKEIQTNNYPVILGSQDLSPFGVGAFTGEEPAEILKDLVSYSIIGHSERRENFAETDKMVSQKFNKAKEAGIEGVVCVQGVETPIPVGCAITAYEPVFAIGTGTPDTPENAEKVAEQIKSGKPEVSVLYGGSVTGQNCRSFTSQKDISGLLIGKASLDAEEFLKIIANCATV